MPTATRRILNTGYLVLVLYLAFATIGQMVGCASSQIERNKVVAVDVHAVLAAIDDAEHLYSGSPAATTWNTEPYSKDPECQAPSTVACRSRHAVFSGYMVTALKSGKALTEAVRATPVSAGGKASLAQVSGALEALTPIVTESLPANSTIAVTLVAAKDAVLKILPLFLE